MAFELPDLPYSHDALADLGMSKETLEYHHDLHHNKVLSEFRLLSHRCLIAGLLVVRLRRPLLGDDEHRAAAVAP